MPFSPDFLELIRDNLNYFGQRFGLFPYVESNLKHVMTPTKKYIWLSPFTGSIPEWSNVMTEGNIAKRGEYYQFINESVSTLDTRFLKSAYQLRTRTESGIDWPEFFRDLDPLEKMQLKLIHADSEFYIDLQKDFAYEGFDPSAFYDYIMSVMTTLNRDPKKVLGAVAAYYINHGTTQKSLENMSSTGTAEMKSIISDFNIKPEAGEKLKSDQVTIPRLVIIASPAISVALFTTGAKPPSGVQARQIPRGLAYLSAINLIPRINHRLMWIWSIVQQSQSAQVYDTNVYTNFTYVSYESTKSVSDKIRISLSKMQKWPQDKERDSEIPKSDFQKALPFNSEIQFCDFLNNYLPEGAGDEWIVLPSDIGSLHFYWDRKQAEEWDAVDRRGKPTRTGRKSQRRRGGGSSRGGGLGGPGDDDAPGGSGGYHTQESGTDEPTDDTTYKSRFSKGTGTSGMLPIGPALMKELEALKRFRDETLANQSKDTKRKLLETSPESSSTKKQMLGQIDINNIESRKAVVHKVDTWIREAQKDRSVPEEMIQEALTLSTGLRTYGTADQTMTAEELMEINNHFQEAMDEGEEEEEYDITYQSAE